MVENGDTSGVEEATDEELTMVEDEAIEELSGEEVEDVEVGLPVVDELWTVVDAAEDALGSADEHCTADTVALELERLVAAADAVKEDEGVFVSCAARRRGSFGGAGAGRRRRHHGTDTRRTNPRPDKARAGRLYRRRG